MSKKKKIHGEFKDEERWEREQEKKKRTKNLKNKRRMKDMQ